VRSIRIALYTPCTLPLLSAQGLVTSPTCAASSTTTEDACALYTPFTHLSCLVDHH
jgi:hypothetical protein